MRTRPPKCPAAKKSRRPLAAALAVLAIAAPTAAAAVPPPEASAWPTTAWKATAQQPVAMSAPEDGDGGALLVTLAGATVLLAGAVAMARGGPWPL